MVKNKQSYWFIAIVFFLLISLLINQLMYVYNAAIEQETHFNQKAQVILDAIVAKVSDDYAVCKTVKESFSEETKACFKNNHNRCSREFKSKKEWLSVDSIIKSELEAGDLNLNYRFDFCKIPTSQTSKNTYTKELHYNMAKSGLAMQLEFPSRSNFLFKQISPVFISSILIILLISMIIIYLFYHYKKEKRNAEKTREFLNNMTHEFKTPLANIAFANNFLQRKSEEITPESIRKYTEIIRSENQKIMESSEDILELAQQEFDFTSIDLTLVNVHDIIYDLHKSFKATNSNTGLDISIKLMAENAIVSGKNSFIQNALSNIIDNAIKYCDREPEITILTFNEEQQLVIAIKDNGIGIPKDEINAVFKKFYRISTGNLHNVKGFGLGLSYVKMMVEKMNGRITVDTEIGVGSTFMIKLPLVDE